MTKFCPECGISLKENYKFCPSCGLDLDLENNREEIKKTQKKINISGRENKSKLSFDSKSFDTKKILYIFLGVFAIAIFILIFSDVITSNETNALSNIPNQNNPQSSSVDLNNLSKINELEDKLKADPNNYELVLQLAHLKNDSGLYEKAIVNYKEYLKKYPKDADVRIDMGVCYFNLGDYKNSISEMKKALEYKPNHQIAHLNLGIVNLAEGNLKESRIWLQKAVEIDSTSDVGKRAKELLHSH
ncbi:MAG: tetratricopeptide repeat protein [Ignavibacteriaceae bacterium]